MTVDLSPPKPVPPKPRIYLAGGTTAVVDQTIAALAESTELYQRGGSLADLVRDPENKPPPDKIWRHGAPRSRVVPVARVQEIVEGCAVFVRKDADGRERQVSPPGWITRTLIARGEWHGIRPLHGLAPHPIMRCDGTIAAESGYDHATGVMLTVPDGVTVPSAPTLDDARAARDVLFDLISDFEVDDTGRAVWLATLLTPLARPAIDGCVPLSLFDANERGAGKTLMADLAGVIVLGRQLARRAPPSTEEEWQKSLLAIALAADPIILLDNLTKPLRSAHLDAALTANTVSGRILGGLNEAVVPFRTQVIATANNAGVSADLVRRSICARQTVGANPERRNGWKYDLPGHATQQRARYLSAGLTILRAYAVAGSPNVESLPAGSFESWGRVVRDPIVWMGNPDPILSQGSLRENADVDTAPLAAVLGAWRELFRGRGVTSSELHALAHNDDDKSPAAPAMRSALAEWTGTDRPDTRTIGNRLRAARDRVVVVGTEELQLLRGDDDTHHKTAKWLVVAR